MIIFYKYLDQYYYQGKVETHLKYFEYIADFADEELADDDVFVLESIAEAKKNDEECLRVTLIITLKDNLLSISRIIKIIEV